VTNLAPAVAAWDVTKSFGTGASRTPILRGVGLTVARGETVFLVGPSGSGKSTLLSILGCLLSPDSGTVQVLGHDVSKFSPESLTNFRRERLGFIFQSFNLFPTLSALDNVRLAMTLRGIGLRTARARAIELLDQVGLGRRARLRPAQLSTGECQRVAIARALVNDPTVIFADEPTASLDAENGQIVLGLLTTLVQLRNAALIVVTHDHRIFPYADRIVQLTDGRIAHDPSQSAFELSI
jgi:putative ABC transport system ATP-binding protein